MLTAPDDWIPQGIDGLEPRSWNAVREVNRSVCVTAGAGAGKTELLAQKATYLLQTGLCPAPRRILAISFKRDAAATLARRVRARCPDARGRRFVSLTFDGFTKGLLDQFRRGLPAGILPPADYRVHEPSRDEVDEFLRRHGSSLNGKQLLDLVARTSIPFEEQDLSRARARLVAAYWEERYGGQTCSLSFSMINRLVERILATNSLVVEALRTTYPFVFLDEFQDTTPMQYSIVEAAFDAGSTRLTAVGDDKQRIMGWAGAMQDGFGRFREDFAPREIQLLWNWRSHEDLVAVQRALAARIDPLTEPVLARKQRSVDGSVCAIWEFYDEREEVEDIATWLCNEIRSGRCKAHEVALLVRYKVDAAETELRPAFEQQGLRLRNVGRKFGSIDLQDLIAEDLAGLLIPLMRLGVGQRERNAWSAAVEAMRAITPSMDEDETAEARTRAKLEAVIVQLRRFMGGQTPTRESCGLLVALVINTLEETWIRQATPAYARDADFARVRDGFVLLLEHATTACTSWSEVIDFVEVKNQVPLMTIHKSKGLEFHTVIFMGFDTRSWRSLTPHDMDELRSFFVAFTRAEQRAFFCSCQGRGGKVAWLEYLLGGAVPRVRLSRTHKENI